LLFFFEVPCDDGFQKAVIVMQAYMCDHMTISVHDPADYAIRLSAEQNICSHAY
jgi:hypothetical protein